MSQCESVLNKCRGDDLGRIKRKLHHIVPFSDPILVGDKSCHGWEHDETAAMLAGIGYAKEVATDISAYDSPLISHLLSLPHTDRRLARFCRAVKKKEITIVSGDWSHVFYDMKLHEAGKSKPGFLRSRELIEVSTHAAARPQ